ncbi:MAG: cell division protein FtsK, partial [Francisellaceae bacterium]|nr:cell division protein FtsK [Francisellaceae bacterium]
LYSDTEIKDTTLTAKQRKKLKSTSKSEGEKKTILNNTPGLRLKEGIFLTISTLALFIFISLATHSNQDPGWSKISSSTQIVNIAGKWGAWISDFTLYFFGYVAFLIPIGVLLVSSKLLKTSVQEHKASTKYLWILNILGLLLTTVGICGVADMHLPHNINLLPSSQGGVIGSYIAISIATILNRTGAELVFIAFILIGLTLSFGVSWILLCEQVGKTAIVAMIKLYEYGIISGKYIRDKWFISKDTFIDNFKKKNLKAFLVPVLESKEVKTLSPKKDPIIIDAIPISEAKIITVTKSVKTLIKSISKPISRPMNTENLGVPDVDLLKDDSMPCNEANYSEEDLQTLALNLERQLKDFNIDAKVEGILPGPIITRFELSLGAGTKVSKITALSKDLARALLVTSVRIVEVIPGKSCIGIEVPNKEREVVQFIDVIKSSQYQDSSAQIPLALGKDISGIPIIADLARMPHLLVAGTTGSGKSVGVNAMILSMLYKLKVEDLRMLLIDPKMLELSVYEGIPHLLTPVITDMSEAANGLRWCVAEMERRYELLAGVGVRNLKSYNEKVEAAIANNKPMFDPTFKGDPSETPILEKLPHIVVVIDEFADMIMVVGKKVEELIARIAQKARAAGIHMILATQRPSVDVITGLIKANVPTRISFQVSSKIDSRTILDQQGAEQLLGHGDMLYLAPGTGIPTRVHGPFVSDSTVHSVVKYFKDNVESPGHSIDLNPTNFEHGGGFARDDDEDDMYSQAINIVLETGKTSSSYLQRRLKIGYNRAARIVESMESNGVLGPMQSNGVREILLNRE